MSSILKALEKVEQERTAQHEGPLGRFQKERARHRPWVMPACVVSGAAAAALITFAAMGGFSGGKEGGRGAAPQAPALGHPSAPRPAVLPAPIPAEVIASPAVRTEGEPNSAAIAEKPRQGVRHATRLPSPAAPSRKSAAPVARLRPAGHGTTPTPVAAVPSAAHHAEPHAAPQGVAATGGAPAASVPRAEIRVTGIAWQKDAGSSVAMINGRQIYEGDSVEGARVKEILPDRVRFVGSGGTFEVPLGAGQ